MAKDINIQYFLKIQYYYNLLFITKTVKRIWYNLWHLENIVIKVCVGNVKLLLGILKGTGISSGYALNYMNQLVAQSRQCEKHFITKMHTVMTKCIWFSNKEQYDSKFNVFILCYCFVCHIVSGNAFSQALNCISNVESKHAFLWELHV